MDSHKENDSGVINISAGNDKIKYYESDDNNCIFEILKDNSNVSEGKSNTLGSQSKILDKNKDKRYRIYGEITVVSVLGNDRTRYLEGTKINLYKINGLSPIFIDSKITDDVGKVVFKNLKKGAYRVIEIVDKRYFEKPKYLRWNEITIDRDNLKEKIVVINKLRKNIL